MGRCLSLDGGRLHPVPRLPRYQPPAGVLPSWSTRVWAALVHSPDTHRRAASWRSSRRHAQALLRIDRNSWPCAGHGAPNVALGLGFRCTRIWCSSGCLDCWPRSHVCAIADNVPLRRSATFDLARISLGALLRPPIGESSMSGTASDVFRACVWVTVLNIDAIAFCVSTTPPAPPMRTCKANPFAAFGMVAPTWRALAVRHRPGVLRGALGHPLQQGCVRAPAVPAHRAATAAQLRLASSRPSRNRSAQVADRSSRPTS